MAGHAATSSESSWSRNDPPLVCIQETKLSMICNALANEILGTAFDYVFLPAVNVSGGILLGWSVDAWTVSDVARGRFTLSAKLSEIGTLSDPWWITVVYGPQLDNDKVQFLEELRQFRDSHAGPWFLCGDFNMIYRAQDKNNDRLDRRCMRRFRSFLNSMHLEELTLVGRRFTWSSERERPTLELLDRMFASPDWFAGFPNHVLKPLSF
jgi:exonuclease III